MKDVSRETSEKLQFYAETLRVWGAKINLVSPLTLQSLDERHIKDSQQLLPHAGEWKKWCDLGSGGGLPGLIVSIHNPDRHVTLIESDARKGVFLRHLISSLNLSATVMTDRIETAQPQSADVVSARALAALDRLIPLALRHGHDKTRYIFPKGARYRHELAEAEQAFRFDVDVRPSITDKDAVILVMENIERV